MINAKLKITSSSNLHLVIQTIGASDNSITVTGPGGSASGSCNKGLVCYTSMPFAYGAYHVTMSVTLADEGQVTSASFYIYAADSLENLVFPVFSGGGELGLFFSSSNNPREFDFTIDNPNPPPPVDYPLALYFKLRNHDLCKDQVSGIIISLNKDIETLPDKNVTLSVSNVGNAIVTFCNGYGDILGSSISVPYNDIHNQNNVMVLVKAQDTVNQTVFVTASSNEVTTHDSLIVNASKRQLIALFESDKLSPGDTVNIVIRKIEDCGYEGYLPDTTQFEVGIKEGCEFGNILSSTGEIAKYFPKICRPIRFIVSKSINVDSANIVLRVGAPEIVQIIMAEKFTTGKSTVKSQKSIKNSTVTSMLSIKKSKKIADQSCTVYNPEFIEWVGFAEATVNGGGDCSKYPCITKDNPIPPQIEYNRQPLDNNYCQDNKNLRGGFISLLGTNKLIQPNNINVCYNSNIDQWQFRINDNNKILFNYQFGICNENLKNMYPKPLFSIEDVEKIPKDTVSVYKAFCDFAKQQKYGSSGDTYFIVDVTRAHEEIHEQDYKKMIDSVYIEWGIDKKFLDIKLRCSKINNYETSKKEITKQINDIQNDFSIKLKKQWLLLTGESQSQKSKVYEEKTQMNQDVVDVIQLYINYLCQLSHIAFPIGGPKCK